MTSLPTIAFIGLGNMGAPMALNLRKAAYPLRVFDLAANAMQALSAAGAYAASSASDAVRDAAIVISMLPASRHVEHLYLGHNDG
ncbi:MAG: NAD(P)-binding domain-containing protein, partial [Burkholderiales bacterium]|nr:NAD(P)-binding domain-containing protein [Burkholderiales bacterium]